MPSISDYNRYVLESGLFAELIRDGFQRESNYDWHRFTRRVEKCWQLVELDKVWRDTFQISFHVHYPEIETLLGRNPDWFFHFEKFDHTRLSHISHGLPEIDGAGDLTWWYDGKRSQQIMADSMVLAWQEYGRVWFKKRSTLTGAADAANRNSNNIQFALFSLAINDFESARAALTKEITASRFRNEERVQCLRQFAIRYGIELGPIADDLIWKRSNEEWNSEEAWKLCVNPYQAYQIVDRLVTKRWRKNRLISIAAAAHSNTNFDKFNDEILEIALERADGNWTRAFDEIQKPVGRKAGSETFRQLMKEEHQFDFKKHLPNQFGYSIENTGPLFLDDRANLSSELIEKATQLYAPFMQIIRDIYGNPFHQPKIKEKWKNANVMNLARKFYDENRFDFAPLLADALEEAGCNESHVLNHLRNDAPHYRGCWVFDSLLNIGDIQPPPAPPSTFFDIHGLPVNFHQHHEGQIETPFFNSTLQMLLDSRVSNSNVSDPETVPSDLPAVSD